MPMLSRHFTTDFQSDFLQPSKQWLNYLFVLMPSTQGWCQNYSRDIDGIRKMSALSISLCLCSLFVYMRARVYSALSK